MTNRNESSISIEADLFEESRKRIYICVYIYMYIRLVIFFSRTNQTTKEGRTNESWIIPRMNRQPRHCSIPDKLSLFFFCFFFFLYNFYRRSPSYYSTWRGGPRRVHKISCRIIFYQRAMKMFSMLPVFRLVDAFRQYVVKYFFFFFLFNKGVHTYIYCRIDSDNSTFLLSSKMNISLVQRYL